MQPSVNSESTTICHQMSYIGVRCRSQRHENGVLWWKVSTESLLEGQKEIWAGFKVPTAVAAVAVTSRRPLEGRFWRFEKPLFCHRKGVYRACKIEQYSIILMVFSNPSFSWKYSLNVAGWYTYSLRNMLPWIWYDYLCKKGWAHSGWFV